MIIPHLCSREKSQKQKMSWSMEPQTLIPPLTNFNGVFRPRFVPGLTPTFVAMKTTVNFHLHACFIRTYNIFEICPNILMGPFQTLDAVGCVDKLAVSCVQPSKRRPFRAAVVDTDTPCTLNVATSSLAVVSLSIECNVAVLYFVGCLDFGNGLIVPICRHTVCLQVTIPSSFSTFRISVTVASVRVIC